VRPTAPSVESSAPPQERYTSVPFAAPPGSREAVTERRKVSPVLIIAIFVAVIALAGIVWMVRSSMSPSGAAAKVEITIFPTTAKMAAGKSADFKANLTGPPTDQVTWKVDEGDSGGQVQVQRGSEGANSLYSTYTAPKTPGTYHLIATSTADPTKSATAEITVTAK
jgi:chitinase